MIWRIKKAFRYIKPQINRTLYLSLVRPLLEHAVKVWFPYLRGDINRLEAVQRRATKLSPTLAELPYEARLEVLDLTTLEERRNRGDLIETYKIINGFTKLDPLKFFEFLPQTYPNTRGHCQKIFKVHSSTVKRRNFFDRRIIDAWKQPTDGWCGSFYH